MWLYKEVEKQSVFIAEVNENTKRVKIVQQTIMWVYLNFCLNNSCTILKQRFCPGTVNLTAPSLQGLKGQDFANTLNNTGNNPPSL